MASREIGPPDGLANATTPPCIAFDFTPNGFLLDEARWHVDTQCVPIGTTLLVPVQDGLPPCPGEFGCRPPNSPEMKRRDVRQNRNCSTFLDDASPVVPVATNRQRRIPDAKTLHTVAPVDDAVRIHHAVLLCEEQLARVRIIEKKRGSNISPSGVTHAGLL